MKKKDMHKKERVALERELRRHRDQRKENKRDIKKLMSCYAAYLLHRKRLIPIVSDDFECNNCKVKGILS